MAAFHQAIEAGADGIEFDVRLTRDVVPVVIHDSTLRRTSGLPHRIADLTLSEVETLNVGVPSLKQLFALFASNDLILNLEMKCDSPSEHLALAEACCRLADEHSLKQRVIISCFDLAALEIVKTIDPEIKTAALFQPAISTPSVWLDQRILDQTAAIGASALALYHRLARRQLIEKAKHAGLWVAVWTVDDPGWIERARSMGVDALITNDPAAMLAHR